MMLLSANAFFAIIDVFTPATMPETLLFAHRPANRACLTKVCDNVAGNCTPVFHDVPLFSDFLQLILAHHAPPLAPSLQFDANLLPMATHSFNGPSWRLTLVFSIKRYRVG